MTLTCCFHTLTGARCAARMIAICVFLLMLPASINAAGWGNSYRDHLLQGMRCSFSQPRWLFAAGGIAGISRFDRDVRSAATGRLLPAPLATMGDYYGKGVNYLLGSGYILSNRLGAAHWSRQQRLEEWQLFTESLVATGAATFLIKKTTQRLRPDGSSRDAFPSGHTSTSFCVAAFLHRRYGGRTAAPAAAMAMLTGISRLHHDRHWFSDVLAGALLGGLLGDGFAELEKQATPGTPPDLHWRLSWVVVF